MQYAIVDDNVEDAPIYRREGKAPKPTRPCENHGLGYGACTYMVGESSETHSQSHLQSLPKDHCKIFQNPGDTGMYIITMADLGLTLQISQQIGPSRSEERKQ